MSYRLSNNSILAQEVRRVFDEELGGAIRQVRGSTGDRGSEAVHEARKHLKRTRTLLRLVRPGLAVDAYAREDAALRRAAHRLSSTRDAHVREQTVRKLIESSSSGDLTVGLQRVHRSFKGVLHRELTASNAANWSELAATDIASARMRIRRCSLQRVDTRTIRNGLKATCKKARRALKVAERDPSETNLHDLRKRVKDLGFELRLLRGDRQSPFRQMEHRLQKLGDQLGNHHDLAMLMLAREADGNRTTQEDWHALEQSVRPQQEKLQRDALRLAHKILQRKPKEFADWVVRHWEQD